MPTLTLALDDEQARFLEAKAASDGCVDAHGLVLAMIDHERLGGTKTT